MDKIHRAPESLTHRIHRLYGALPAGERKVADLVLDSPGELALLAAGEVSDRSGVSNATVSRFFRRLGYDSYDSARRAARDMRASGSPLYLADREGRERRSGRLAEAQAVETALIEASLSMINPLTLNAVADAVAGARRVRFAGFRNSHFIAAYGQSTLAQFRPDVTMLRTGDQSIAEAAAQVEADDVIIVVGLRRRPADFNLFVRLVAEAGAAVALIADRSIREAPARVRWMLPCAVETPQALDSYVGALAVMRALLGAAVDRLGAAGRRWLERSETLHETFGDLE